MIIIGRLFIFVRCNGRRLADWLADWLAGWYNGIGSCPTRCCHDYKEPRQQRAGHGGSTDFGRLNCWAWRWTLTLNCCPPAGQWSSAGLVLTSPRCVCQHTPQRPSKAKSGFLRRSPPRPQSSQQPSTVGKPTAQPQKK